MAQTLEQALSGIFQPELPPPPPIIRPVKSEITPLRKYEDFAADIKARLDQRE